MLQKKIKKKMEGQTLKKQEGFTKSEGDIKNEKLTREI